MIPTIFGALRVETEFFETSIFVLFEILGIVEPPMNMVEKLRDSDWHEAGLVVEELRLVVRGDRITGSVEPVASEKKGMAGLDLVGSESEGAVCYLSLGGGERTES